MHVDDHSQSHPQKGSGSYPNQSAKEVTVSLTPKHVSLLAERGGKPSSRPQATNTSRRTQDTPNHQTTRVLTATSTLQKWLRSHGEHEAPHTVSHRLLATPRRAPDLHVQATPQRAPDHTKRTTKATAYRHGLDLHTSTARMLQIGSKRGARQQPSRGARKWANA